MQLGAKLRAALENLAWDWDKLSQDSAAHSHKILVGLKSWNPGVKAVFVASS